MNFKGLLGNVLTGKFVPAAMMVKDPLRYERSNEVLELSGQDIDFENPGEKEKKQAQLFMDKTAELLVGVPSVLDGMLIDLDERLYRDMITVTEGKKVSENLLPEEISAFGDFCENCRTLFAEDVLSLGLGNDTTLEQFVDKQDWELEPNYLRLIEIVASGLRQKDYGNNPNFNGHFDTVRDIVIGKCRERYHYLGQEAAPEAVLES